MKWLKIASKFVIGLVLVFFALVGLLYATRGTPARLVYAFNDPAGPPAVGDSAFYRSIELLTHTDLQPGHHIEYLLNGDESYPRLWQDLRGAQRSIIFHVYYWKPGRIAETFRDVVIERARAGVDVLVLFDAFGAQDMSNEYIESLEAAGVRTADYRPLRWYTLHKAQNRSHMRLIVIDDSIGYTGGFGMADHWIGDGVRHGWRETNIRFTGPAVSQMQANFAIAWAEATGELLTGRSIAGQSGGPSGAAEARAGLLYANPTLGSTPAERFLILSIAGARHRLLIANAYFVPSEEFTRQLITAARRGVDVRVLTAGPATDVKSVRHAGHSRYERLLAAGVRVFEYQPQMMHSKTMVVDGRWGTVGTMNFDMRSIAFNDESNLLFDDPALGAQLERQFLADLPYSKEMKLDLFRQRSFFHKGLDRTASWIAELL